MCFKINNYTFWNLTLHNAYVAKCGANTVTKGENFSLFETYSRLIKRLTMKVSLHDFLRFVQSIQKRYLAGETIPKLNINTELKVIFQSSPL